MLKIPYAGCLGLSRAILVQFTFKMCCSAKYSLKPLFWGSRLFKVTDIDKLNNLVTNACYDKQHVQGAAKKVAP